MKNLHVGATRAAFAVAVLVLPAVAMAAGHRSGMGWFDEHVLNAVIHAVVYGVIFKVFRAIGLVASLVLGAVILMGAYLWYRSRTA